MCDNIKLSQFYNKMHSVHKFKQDFALCRRAEMCISSCFRLTSVMWRKSKNFVRHFPGHLPGLATQESPSLQRPNSQNILGQFYDILHTHANVLIHKTSYDNFTTKILRSLFRCLM